MTNATHINKKTKAQVKASVAPWLSADGEKVIQYRQMKDGKGFGPSKIAVEARFNELYEAI